MVEQTSHPTWINLLFTGGAIFSAILLVGLAVQPDLIHDRIMERDASPAPLLKTGQTYQLTAETLIKPDFGGAFSAFEKDGIWLLQGLGTIEFELLDGGKRPALEIGISSLPTETTIQFSAGGVDRNTDLLTRGEVDVALVALSDGRAQQVDVSCRIVGAQVDLGRDIRDLCVKLQWVRVLREP